MVSPRSLSFSRSRSQKSQHLVGETSKKGGKLRRKINPDEPSGQFLSGLAGLVYFCLSCKN